CGGSGGGSGGGRVVTCLRFNLEGWAWQAGSLSATLWIWWHHNNNSNNNNHNITVSQIRTRRSVSRDCSVELSGRCCRESVDVNVSDLGWDNWFIQPQAFTFYYCRGTCNAAFNLARTLDYTSTKEALMLQSSWQAVRTDLMPCCAPTSYSSMSVIYRHTRNNTLLHTTIDNLLVQSCGCQN
ncbi:hypothetical protein Pcinc_020714, partial [Petrolisthes cinctipes]